MNTDKGLYVTTAKQRQLFFQKYFILILAWADDLGEIVEDVANKPQWQTAYTIHRSTRRGWELWNIHYDWRSRGTIYGFLNSE
jgi:hypothetical protein